MRVELFPPDAETEPRHWVRHDQAFAIMLRPGSIEWGSKRSPLEKFDYAAGDLALCDPHVVGPFRETVCQEIHNLPSIEGGPARTAQTSPASPAKPILPL
jgi:hypothetical protein